MDAIKNRKHPSEECILVYAHIHQRINEVYKVQRNSICDIASIMISATERHLAYELLISRNKARKACSALVKHGYLYSQSIGKRALYRLTDQALDISSITQAIKRIDIDEVNELLKYFNECLQNNRIPQDLRLKDDNEFHMLFLQELKEMFNGDMNKCKFLIDSHSEIFNCRFGHKSAQRLATHIRKTLDKPFIRKRVNATRDWSISDKFLRRRYHLRKRGIDIFLLDDPFDPNIEVDENE